MSPKDELLATGRPVTGALGRHLEHRMARNEWLPRKDSNLDKVIQSHLCYHYTTRHLNWGGRICLASPSPATPF